MLVLGGTSLDDGLLLETPRGAVIVVDAFGGGVPRAEIERVTFHVKRGSLIVHHLCLPPPRADPGKIRREI